MCFAYSIDLIYIFFKIILPQFLQDQLLGTKQIFLHGIMCAAYLPRSCFEWLQERNDGRKIKVEKQTNEECRK